MQTRQFKKITNYLRKRFNNEEALGEFFKSLAPSSKNKIQIRVITEYDYSVMREVILEKRASKKLLYNNTKLFINDKYVIDTQNRLIYQKEGESCTISPLVTLTDEDTYVIDNILQANDY